MAFGNKHNRLLNSTHYFVQHLKQSFSLDRFFYAFKFRITWLSFALGIIGVFYTAAFQPSLFRLCFAACTEELTWRTLAQNQCEEITDSKQFLGISYGNYLCSSLFAMMHLFTQAPIAALSTFFPSLIFGLIWTRFKSTWLCALLHIWYNIVFFYM